MWPYIELGAAHAQSVTAADQMWQPQYESDSNLSMLINSTVKCHLVHAGGVKVPRRYAVIDGQLPSGLSLDPITGTISGVPKAEEGRLDHQDFEVEVEAVDTWGLRRNCKLHLHLHRTRCAPRDLCYIAVYAIFHPPPRLNLPHRRNSIHENALRRFFFRVSVGFVTMPRLFAHFVIEKHSVDDPSIFLAVGTKRN